MTKKQHTLYGLILLIVGIIGGIAGTAFSMGEEKQRINDTLARNTAEIAVMVIANEVHEKATQQELDRFIEVVARQMTKLNDNIAQLTTIAGNLRTDVSVLKALMDRVESDLKSKNSSG